MVRVIKLVVGDCFCFVFVLFFRGGGGIKEIVGMRIECVILSFEAA